ncbi:MAG: CheR family methyltransferase [Devosia sp.]|uniref:CheR family methyltransferase n=1 Tax=Devosia sp. TaxID=1871048 RepID=UPI00339AC9D5
MALVSRAPILEADGEDHLSQADFAKISALIGSEAGIRLPPAKRLMVEGRLRRRLRALQIATFDAYCDYIFRHDGLKAELPYLINVVTTNKTDFFREPEHFELMRSKMVPELLAARDGERNPHLKIWSAASSTGAEAFTCAMVLADMAKASKNFRFSILGTDISTDVLDMGRRAVYPAEQIVPVPQSMQAQYLMWARKAGLRPDVRIVPELRRLVQFHRLNLMDEKYPFDRDVDIILLRNVLIYFDKADQAKVINRLVGHLRPGGYLLLGHSESMIGTSIPVRQVAPAVFQRV